jgi:hypothetical protein
LDSAAHPGNPTATPELVLSLIEKLMAIANDFSNSFTKHLMSGDMTGNDQSEAIKHANLLAQAVYGLLNDCKGITRFAGDEHVIETLLANAKSTASFGKKFFQQLQSAHLSAVDLTQRPQKIQQCNAEFQSTLHPMMKVAESLVAKDVADTVVATEDDFGDVVERELGSATKAIQDAAALLARLLSQDRPRDPALTQTDVQAR